MKKKSAIINVASMAGNFHFKSRLNTNAIT